MLSIALILTSSGNEFVCSRSYKTLNDEEFHHYQLVTAGDGLLKKESGVESEWYTILHIVTRTGIFFSNGNVHKIFATN